MEDPAKPKDPTSEPQKAPEKAAEEPTRRAGEAEPMAKSPAPVPKFLRTEWPLALTAFLGACVALLIYNFQTIVAEPGIAWRNEKPDSPPLELHLKPGASYGRMTLRNLTGKVYLNIGVELKVTEGALVRGIFTPGAGDVLSPEENREMSRLETGPKTAPFVLRQHAARFDPDRTLVFDYSGTDLGEVSPGFTEGVGRTEFLGLKQPAGKPKTAETKVGQPVEMHLWGWRDSGLENKNLLTLLTLAICIIATAALLFKFIKHKET